MAPSDRYPPGALSDTRTRPPVRAERAQRARRRTPLGLVAIPLVLVLAGIGLFLILGRGGGGGLPLLGGGGSEEIPAFGFVVRKTRAVPTAEGAEAKALASDAEAVAGELTPILDDLFTAAFLDPGAWGDGDYTAVWDRFSEEARPTAEQSVETLTLGVGAADVYERVTPKRGVVSYEVLFDARGNPASIVATFSFSALGARTDGTYTAIVSTGQLFLGAPGDWKITAFEVRRHDRPAKAPASPTAPATT